MVQGAGSVICHYFYRHFLFRDVPKIDSGVRMLCMDGGGAKGVIEATILDKIFITVAATLKVPKAPPYLLM